MLGMRLNWAIRNWMNRGTEGVELVGQQPCLKVGGSMAPMAGPFALSASLFISCGTWLLLGDTPEWGGWRDLSTPDAVLALLVVLGGLLLHEFMHLAAFYRAGGKHGSVRARLHFGVIPGLAARMRLEAGMDDWRTLTVISLAGPIGSFVVALLLNAFAPQGGILYWGTVALAAVSLANLLPLRGSDGFYALQALRQRTRTA
jgi:Zn-dependent protease